MRLMLPFRENKGLRDNFMRFDKETFRVGKILEIMDLVSGRVCYKHLEILKRHNFVCVTASVDSIRTSEDFFDINQNMVIDGFLTYTGNSTMEVRVELKDENEEVAMEANYLFVAKYH